MYTRAQMIDAILALRLDLTREQSISIENTFFDAIDGGELIDSDDVRYAIENPRPYTQ